LSTKFTLQTKDQYDFLIYLRRNVRKIQTRDVHIAHCACRTFNHGVRAMRSSMLSPSSAVGGINIESTICTTPFEDTRSGTITLALFSLPSTYIARIGSGKPGGMRFVTDRTPCTRIPICFMMLRPINILHGFASSGYASRVSKTSVSARRHSRKSSCGTSAPRGTRSRTRWYCAICCRMRNAMYGSMSGTRI